MKRVVGICLVLALAIMIALPNLSAQDQKKKKKKGAQKNQAVAGLLQQLDKAGLTEDQKAKVKELTNEYGPKLQQARQKAGLSREQQRSRATALKKARDEGKKGAAIQEAADAAANLTAEQKAALAQMRQLQTEYRRAVLAVLTPEQREKAGLKGGKKGAGAPKKKAKKKAADK